MLIFILMINSRKRSGSITRINGLKFENEIYNLLKNNQDLIKNIIINYNNINNLSQNIQIHSITNISVLLVNQLKIQQILSLKKKYKQFYFDLPINNKRAADIVIVYIYNNNLYHIGIDTKKSKSNMTQLVRKSYKLFQQYITHEEFLVLQSYLQYKNSSRIWKTQHYNFKLHLCNILQKIKHKWILERFDDNQLYYNHLILSKTNNILQFISVHKLLQYLHIDFCTLKRTNFVFAPLQHNLLTIKPHGSKKWMDLQLAIYKKAFLFKDISFYIKI